LSSELLGLALLGLLAFAAAAGVVLAPLRGGPRARAGLVLAAASFVVAGAVYLAIGQPAAVGGSAPPDDPAEQFARQVTERLALQPEDAAGWRMLGGIRGMQGRYGEASTAFARARSLSGDSDPGAIVGYAEAQVLEDPSRLAAMAPLFARTLELDPDDQKALWYGGHAASEAGDHARATALWTRLLQQDIPEPLRAAVRARIAPGAAAEAAAPAGAASAATLLEVEVALAPELAARAQPGSPLFVFVRAPGVMAPVLVKRVAQPRFPLLVSFTAADRLGEPVAIAAGFTVGARLSKAGIAGRGSGDIEGSASVAPGRRVELTLDGVVP
jgi:cytochrome c-type biogenesis protein CcmH